MSDTSGAEDHGDIEVRVTQLERRLGVYSGPWPWPDPFPCRIITINVNIPGYPHGHDTHDPRDAQLTELLERVRRLEEQAGLPPSQPD
jgi:hypothetical protein